MLNISVRNDTRTLSLIAVVLNTPKSQLLIGELQHSVRGEFPIVPSALSAINNLVASEKTLPLIRGFCVLIFPARSGLPGHSKPSVLPCSSWSSQLLMRIGNPV